MVQGKTGVLVLGMAVGALFVGCTVDDGTITIGGDANDQFAYGNAEVFDADMTGPVGLVQPAEGRVTRSSGFDHEGHLYDVQLESTVADGASMLFVYMLDLLTPGTPSGSVFYSTATDGDVIMDADGDTYIRIDDEDTVTEVSEDELGAAECSGPTLGDYPYDEPMDNVAIRVEDCADCDQEGVRRIDYAAWNTREGDEQPITGTFYYKPNLEEASAEVDLSADESDSI